jgi:hypothetical protein
VLDVRERVRSEHVRVRSALISVFHYKPPDSSPGRVSTSRSSPWSTTGLALMPGGGYPPTARDTPNAQRRLSVNVSVDASGNTSAWAIR